jgi:hypothetical protein
LKHLIADTIDLKHQYPHAQKKYGKESIVELINKIVENMNTSGKLLENHFSIQKELETFLEKGFNVKLSSVIIDDVKQEKMVGNEKK